MVCIFVRRQSFCKNRPSFRFRQNFKHTFFLLQIFWLLSDYCCCSFFFFFVFLFLLKISKNCYDLFSLFFFLFHLQIFILVFFVFVVNAICLPFIYLCQVFFFFSCSFNLLNLQHAYCRLFNLCLCKMLCAIVVFKNECEGRKNEKLKYNRGRRKKSWRLEQWKKKKMKIFWGCVHQKFAVFPIFLSVSLSFFTKFFFFFLFSLKN